MKKVVFGLLIVVVIFGQIAQVFGQNDSYHVEDFYIDDVANLRIWPDQNPDNIIILRLDFATNECGSGWFFMTRNDSELAEILLTVAQTGQASDQLDESVIVNGQNINEFLIYWHNVLENDHPLPKCNTVYLPIVIN